ncbi:MAG: hypothetical protein MUO42_12990, partial [Anaerolineaceae bacterium]|nr:hypothetical protein [Anaerolineaceae bacterium]
LNILLHHPEFFVFGCHLQKVFQPLFKFRRASSRPIDSAYANSLITFKKIAEVLPGLFICLQRLPLA